MLQTITNPQIQKIHALLRNIGMIEDKREYIQHFTNGRKSSVKELTMQEGCCLIQLLCDVDPKEKQKRSIISLAYTANIIYGNTQEDHKMNAAKLNLFLNRSGTVKKDLDKMTLEELVKVHKQFEAMVINIRKTNDNKQAKKVTDKLLQELNITVK